MIADDYDAMRDALSSPGSYLDPVCESVNAYFPTAKRITNVRPRAGYPAGRQVGW